MAKKSGSGRERGKRLPRNREVGHAVRIVTQYDGTVVGEITARDGAVYVVTTATGKTYRVLSAEIL